MYPITSRIAGELEVKREEKEITRMWKELWTLAKVFAVGMILVSTHGLQVFALVSMIVIALVIYKLNK